MGSAGSVLAGAPEEIDHETFKLICGDRYDVQLWHAMKNDRGFISKSVLQTDIGKQTIYELFGVKLDN